MVISFEARRFSTARAQIMGYAMLCIVFFHSSFPIAETSLFYAIKNLCDIGVDIFLFVSGIGIWFSLNKHANVAAYVQRRCLRILPAFFDCKHAVVFGNGFCFIPCTNLDVHQRYYYT